MPVNTKAHTDNHAEEFQRLMHNHDYAMTLALQFREKKEPDVARAYYNAAQHYKTLARGL